MNGEKRRAGAAWRGRESSCGGQLRRHTDFTSAILPGSRAVTVYLPPGYEDEPDRRWPLLILQDGQNVFESEIRRTAHATWRVAEAADAAIAAGEVEPLLIAGVANVPERRLAEYTPSCDWSMGGGEAEQYRAMLMRELLPFLRAQYRVRSGAADTGIGGSSLGGLVSLWLGLRDPQVFGRLGVLSPSIWWNHRSILRIVDDIAPGVQPRPRVWLDIGEQEGEAHVADAEVLAARLTRHGWREGGDLRFEKVAGGRHDEASWSERVGPMLRFLFPAEG